MQVRIWAELIAGGSYTSLDVPPHNNSMFEKAGCGGGSSKSLQKDSSVSKVLAEAASAITSAFNSPKASAPSLHGSPARLIESRSKLYKQLSELQNLGVLTDIEYAAEKDTIMELLAKLGGKGK